MSQPNALPEEIVMGRTPDRRYMLVFVRVHDRSTLGRHVALSPCGNYRVLFRPVPGSNGSPVRIIFDEDGDVRALPPTPPRPPRPSRLRGLQFALDFPPFTPRSPSASPPHQPVDSPRRGVRRPREPSPESRMVRMRMAVDDLIGTLQPELLTELASAINRRVRISLRRSPSPPPRPRLPTASATQTDPTNTRPRSAPTTTACGGGILPPISSILPPPRGTPTPPPQLPAAGPSTPPSSPGVVRPRAVRGRPGRTPPQRPSNPPRIVRRNRGRVVTFVSSQPRSRAVMRPAASSAFTATERRTWGSGADAGAPVSRSAERGTQAVPSAPPQDGSDSDSDRTISPTFSLLSTASTPPVDPSASPVLFEHVYVDPDADREAWSSTPPPQCTPPASLHLLCLPIWSERVTTQPPPLQDCILCGEERAHHAVRCRQCEQLSGCCSCIWKFQRSRYNSGCPCCQYTGLMPPNQRSTPAAEEFWDAELPDLAE